MRKLTLMMATALWANTAGAHEGHGLTVVHLHGSEYALIAAFIVVAIVRIRRKP